MKSLKEETEELHREAEQTNFSQRMLNGELTKEEYGRYLKVMEGVFEYLEEHSEVLHPSMVRKERVRHDIESMGLESQPEMSEWGRKYIEYLDTLSQIDKWAHVYLHYLAIVYGGQLIKKNVPDDGTMYDFENQSEIVQAIRSKQEQYEEEWISEAMTGYYYMIRIFEELDES